MERRDFIRKMLGLGTLVSVPPLGFLSGWQREKYDWTNNSFSVPIYDDFIRGMWYYEGRNNSHWINIGDPLDLVREPENKYDRNAIEIYWKALKLGYLPREDNLVLSNLLDRGMLLKADVKEVYANNSLHERIRINVEIVIPDNPEFRKRMAENRLSGKPRVSTA